MGRKICQIPGTPFLIRAHMMTHGKTMMMMMISQTVQALYHVTAAVGVCRLNSDIAALALDTAPTGQRPAHVKDFLEKVDPNRSKCEVSHTRPPRLALALTCKQWVRTSRALLMLRQYCPSNCRFPNLILDVVSYCDFYSASKRLNILRPAHVFQASHSTRKNSQILR